MTQTIQTTIHRLEPEDWETYKSLRLEALQDSPEAFCASLETNLQHTDDEWKRRLENADKQSHFPIVSRTRDQYSGLAWCTLQPSGKTAHIYQMWVSPSFRSLGVGQKLLKDMIEWSYASGALYVELEVLSGNDAAKKLYLKAGFVDAGPPTIPSDNPELVTQVMRINRFQGY